MKQFDDPEDFEFEPYLKNPRPVGFFPHYKGKEKDLKKKQIIKMMKREGSLLSSKQRDKIARLIEKGKRTSFYKGWAVCRLCDEQLGSSDVLVKGFILPSRWEHYVRKHKMAPLLVRISNGKIRYSKAFIKFALSK
jgi:hypothetical protein